MKKLTILVALLSFLMVGCVESKTSRVVEDFNFDWRFRLGDNELYAKDVYDDSGWRVLHLPHDWSIEGEFSLNNPSTPSGGALPGGVGWYRKRFTTPDISGKVVNVEFDGVFMNSTVYVNGHEVGHRPYGYSSFSYDITPYLYADGKENVIAVRCDNSEQPNSRWYAGCGIYRNVRLVTTTELHIEYSGTHITTPSISERSAIVHSVVTVTNKSKERKTFKFVNSVYDGNGKRERKSEITRTLKPGESDEIEMDMQIMGYKQPIYV